jgi:hypothetical protein
VKGIEPFFIWYMAGWMIACLIALGIFIRKPEAFSISSIEYRNFLLLPWKLVSFVVATMGLTIIAPYTGDPTWDYFDSIFMSIFTFFTAPWVIGTLFVSFRKKFSFATLYVAVCLWLFSTSWSYDLYIVLRDGSYPATWLANILASAVLYFSAGLMWNLDWKVNRGMIFSFQEEGWPGFSANAQFTKIFWVALPFMLLVAASALYFVLPGLF